MADSPSVNPYAPPTAEPAAPASDPAASLGLASRWARLGAALIDALIALVITLPLYIAIGFANLAALNTRNPLAIYAAGGKWGLVSGMGALALLALQSVLIARRGQSLGKIVVGTRIVTVSGRPLRFVEGVLLRSWLPAVCGLVPYAGSLVTFVDVLFVFRSDRRCLHDLIAGTRVVRIGDGG
jgi:uncharacterized RDD family membrane protein YckC